jgi:hypothetical protein
MRVWLVVPWAMKPKAFLGPQVTHVPQVLEWKYRPRIFVPSVRLCDPDPTNDRRESVDGVDTRFSMVQKEFSRTFRCA